MDFEQSHEYLLSLGNEVAAMKLGLENIGKLLKALDEPQNAYLRLQVAGTNGKGSVCAFLDSICLSAGIRTGLFTSPHLISITERVQIDGQPISEPEFAKYAAQVRRIAETLLDEGELETIPTFFEQITAIALVAFADLKVELAIVETGLGGRLDATTAANAEIAVITRIDYDHQQYLGNSLVQIAAEKAAIIRPESAVVISAQPYEAMKVILDRATAFGIRPHLADLVRTSDRGGWLKFETAQNEYALSKLGLLGRHQVENAKTAILTAEVLDKKFSIGRDDIVTGLERARNPGRLEFQERYLFDGAHNPAGAKALRAFLVEEIDRPITMIFGVMQDKNAGEIAQELFPLADQLILTEARNSRSMKTAEIIAKTSESIPVSVHQTRTVEEALRLAERLSSPESIILVTGSLYLIGEAKRLLQDRRTNLKFEISNLR
jgi:dihydrofolate synthase / folylpolyglutamate synthase